MGSPTKKAIVFDFISDNERKTESHANSAIINSLMKELENSGYLVEYSPFFDKGLMSYVVRFGKLLGHNIPKSTVKLNYDRRVMFSSIFFILSYLFSKFDIKLKKRIGTLNHIGYDLVIVTYPYLYVSIKEKIKPTSKVILLEYNVESKYFAYNLSGFKLSVITNLLTRIISKIEVDAIKQADEILVVSKNDKTYMEAMTTKKNANVISLEVEHITFELFHLHQEILPKFQSLSRNNYRGFLVNVFFLGSNYLPNIKTVFDIIDIAKNKELFNVRFHIVGSVASVFSDASMLPENIVLHGYVDNLFRLLSYADFFLVFGKMDTGYETKMLEYLKYNRPVISKNINSDFLKGKIEIININSYSDVVTILKKAKDFKRDNPNSTIFRIPHLI